MLRDGVPVKRGDRIADVDPRGRTDDLDHLSDKSLRVAEGVLEAMLGLIAEGNRRGSPSKARGAAKTKRKAPTKTTPAEKSKPRPKSKVASAAVNTSANKSDLKPATQGRKKTTRKRPKKG